MYLVEYTTGRSEGFVFTIFLTNNKGRETFDIQNNAKFRKSKHGFKGIDFVEDPLGGVWRQKQIVSAIKQIEKQPTVTVAIRESGAPPAEVTCEAYTDPRKK